MKKNPVLSQQMFETIEQWKQSQLSEKIILQEAIHKVPFLL